MSAIEKVLTLIDKMRNINNLCDKIVIEENAEYDSRLYITISNLYNDIEGLNLPSFDILLIQFKFETRENDYEKAIKLLKNEIELFYKWYQPQKETIDNLFCYDAISDIIIDKANMAYSFELEKAENEINNAAEDKRIWHELAKCYGTCTLGGKTDKDFTESDWDDIKPALDRYEKHFGQKVVDFPGMYSDYHSTGYYLVEKAQDKYQKIIHERNEYCDKLSKLYVVDVFAQLFDILQPIFSHLCSGNGLISDTTENTSGQSIKPLGKRVYNKYESLEECIPDVIDVIDKWAGQYCKEHGEIDTIFGRQIFDFVKRNQLFSNRSCARDHFGDLLIIHFGNKCSFVNGKSLEGKKQIDEKLGIWIRDYETR